jgi:two-component system CheB/CheR fusion protein
MSKRDPKRPRKAARPRPAATARRTKSPRTAVPGAERPNAAAGSPTTAPEVTPESGEPEPASSGASSAFPVVGIGASAGGLEALELFLKNVPEHSGMAYVVVQHLDPKHKGAMVELLQRASKMRVVEVEDRQKVEPDCVFVIPPNKDMSILHGVLHLLPQTSPRGLNLPIDFFFRSLAEDQQERSIAVVLSGMGSDGTLGLRAIKEKAGAGFVQSIETAKFSGMPRSVIDAGLADVVAPAEELPGRIVAYHRHATFIAQPEAALEQKQVSALEKVLILLRAHTGNDFSLYKRSTIYRRIERRMGLHQVGKIANYVRYLRENPGEVELLFKELLIGVTSFFRDPPAWDHLRSHVLPELLRARPQGAAIRAWVPGCSTGEEAYSLAMILMEAIDEGGGGPTSLQIFATDLDREAIEKARLGIYPSNIAADVSPERLRRFFMQDERGYRVRKEIRESVVFAPQNVIMDPPFTKLDILSCRNLLIYLSADLQRRLIPLFHYALNPGGVLFLGTAETVGTYSTLFAPLDGKTRIYRRLASTAGAPVVDFPPGFSAAHMQVNAGEAGPPDHPRTPITNLSILADRAIVQHLAPTAILTNDRGEILYFSGRTGKYLEPGVGKAELNIFGMAREGLRYELSGAFATAVRDTGPVMVPAVKVVTDSGTQAVDLTVQKLVEPKELRGHVLISIEDIATTPEPPQGKAKRTAINVRLGDLERELQHAREEVQTTREEMQTSQEELKSTNEELQSTNEELQSTNEELTTSKEEMQSMNEELQTVNHELQSKVDELSRSNNDMKNLLNSTDIATLFLDSELLVRRFTTPASKLIKLIPTDAGRPITDIATELDYPALADDSREVLRTLVFREKEVAARDGRWFQVRILPYRTLENVIDGVVITFTDATGAKRLESALRDQANQLQQMTEALPNLVWGCRPDGACDYLGHRWVDYTGVPEAEQLGYGWLDRVHPEERERVRELWKAAVGAGAQFDTEFRIINRDGVYHWFKATLVPIRGQEGSVLKWYCTCTEVDALKRSVDDRKQAADRLASILEVIEDPFIAVDEQLGITYFNPAAESLFARNRKDVVGKLLVEAFPMARDPAFRARLDEARQERRALVFEARLDVAQGAAPYTVRIAPHTGGVSIFCRRVAAVPGGHSPRG